MCCSYLEGHDSVREIYDGGSIFRLEKVCVVGDDDVVGRAVRKEGRVKGLGLGKVMG